MSRLLILFVFIVLTQVVYAQGISLKKDSIIKNNINNDPLQVIGFNDTLILKQRDKRCGEWGGDEKIIEIYKAQRRDTTLTANYYEVTRDCDDPYNKSKYKIKKIVTNIKLTPEDKNLTVECILQLLQYQLNKESYPTRAGIVNSVKISDSSLLIRDYPSCKWDKFHLLINSLLRK